MPITTAQLEKRKAHLGSSDVAAILGLDHRRSPYDIWLEKTGKLVEEPAPDNGPLAAGTYFEDGVLQFAERELGKLTRNQYRSAKDHGLPLGANIDAILDASGIPVEAKTAGLFGPLYETWGENGTDEVPDRVLIQCTVHMICTMQGVCYVPAFIGGRGFQNFVVERDDYVVDKISVESAKFWTNHVLADIPPEDSTPHLAFVKRLRREPSKTIQIPQDLIDSWHAAKDSVKAAYENKELTESALLLALGDAEAGECDTGTLTYFQQTRKAHEVAESTFRVARFKKAKK